MADPAGLSNSDRKSSSGAVVVALVASTIIAAAGGGLLGMMLGAESSKPQNAIDEKPAEEHAAPGGSEKTTTAPAHGAAPERRGKETAAAQKSKLRLKELAPIVTNLAAPDTGWVRLQAAIVYDAEAAPQVEILVSEVTADVVALLRTVSLVSIQGADGLRRLHEDLTERAMTRSEGRIREFIIQALVVQ